MARIVFLSNKSTLIISLYVILLFFVFERKLDPRERLRRYLGLELTAANATLNNDVCEITFDLEHCSCQRTIQSLLPNGCPGFYASTKGILQRIKDEYGESTCGDWATLRGPHQNVISYSAFGDFPNEYFNGMVEIMPQLPKAYPGWYTRFYHRMNMQNPIHRNWLCSLACKYPFLDLCDAEKLPVFGNVTGSVGQVWRFTPMGDDFVDRFMIRDSDSAIIQREVDAVHDWIAEGTCFHAMRDHPLHKTPILAGMWGGCNTWKTDVIEVTKRILQGAPYPQKTRFADQQGLTRLLWNMAIGNMTVHAAYLCKKYGGPAKPFPTQRVNLTYIGEKTYISDAKALYKINTPCPKECRPKDHQDWQYC
ncbi:uncharacterized protein LOC135204299 isoform X1 [Macrobrachium nipponense]|uniref:uncharacterized protein LOC135204299 isoform X1 n=1 Tax=Macrobrachium nipponense TaxID=159736 RepID=UPI0030C7DFCF